MAVTEGECEEMTSAILCFPGERLAQEIHRPPVRKAEVVRAESPSGGS